MNAAADLKVIAAAAEAPGFDRKAAIAAARRILAPRLRERAAPVYPVAALGPLAPVCEAIAQTAQLDPAMAGQSLLGAASLLVQGLHNVRTLAGIKPLSLFLLTLADSGDGKSTAEGLALRTVTQWQRDAAKRHAEAMHDYERERATRKKGDEPAEAPASPFRVCRDATVEGLRREFTGGPIAQGLFTAEAAAVLSGYGMSAEHRAKTAGTLNAIWDDGLLSVSRATGGRTELYGRRLAAHLMIQPIAAADLLADPLMSAIGLFPRFLVAWPTPAAPRVHRPFKPEGIAAAAPYWKRCTDLLAEALPDDAFDAPTIDLQPAAEKLLGAAYETFERQGKRGELRPIKPFAARAIEQACRVAGVLCAFAGRSSITDDDAAGALELVGYSLQTWLAIIDEGASDPVAGNALKLYDWLTDRPGWCEKLAAIVNAGPACVRSRDKRDAALDLLAANRLCEVREGKASALIPPEGAA